MYSLAGSKIKTLLAPYKKLHIGDAVWIDPRFVDCDHVCPGASLLSVIRRPLIGSDLNHKIGLRFLIIGSGLNRHKRGPGKKSGRPSCIRRGSESYLSVVQVESIDSGDFMPRDGDKVMQPRSAPVYEIGHFYGRRERRSLSVASVNRYKRVCLRVGFYGGDNRIGGASTTPPGESKIDGDLLVINSHICMSRRPENHFYAD